MPNKFSPANLPAYAQPWGREMEAAYKELSQEKRDLLNRLSTEQVLRAVADTKSAELQEQVRIICALAGFTYPPVMTSTTAQPVVVNPTPATASTTKEFPAQWSATWYQSFKRTTAGGTNNDSQSLYQRGSGYTYSMWRFDIGPARGKTITKVEIYLSNISTYYNGAFTVFLGTHGFASEPGSRPAGGRVNPFNYGWTAGHGKWVPVPENLYKALSNGSIQGFTMGDTISDRQNFARFRGVGFSTGAPRIRVTYNG